MSPGSPVLDEIDREITALLARDGPLSTREVADRVGISRATAYRRCRKLEKSNGVTSQLVPSDHPLYFFPVTGDVLTSANYQDLGSTIAKLKKIGRSVGAKPRTQLTPKQKSELLAKYRREFTRLEKAASPSERVRIESFERQLLTVMAGTTLADVVGLFGLRAFYAKERMWDGPFPPPPPPPPL